MNKIFIAAISLLPSVAMAGTVLGTLGIIRSWIDFLIPLLMTLAVVVFFWGLVKFIMSASDEAAKEGGKNLMIWGMIALFVMVAFWGIIAYFQTSIGLQGGQIQAGGQPQVIPPF